MTQEELNQIQNYIRERLKPLSKEEYVQLSAKALAQDVKEGILEKKEKYSRNEISMAVTSYLIKEWQQSHTNQEAKEEKTEQ
jgi:hypothetical protein